MTRIALISDIHFGEFSRTIEFSVPGEPIKDENSGGESLKKCTIELLKREHIEYLCVAGDLTSKGSPQEFSYCEQLLTDIADELGLARDKILLGLGNHDIDWNISNLYKQFDATKPEFPLELVKDKYRKIAAQASLANLESIPYLQNTGPAPFSGVLENDNFVMFILNTGWYCTDNQTFSHGKLDEKQLEWFEKQTNKYKSSTKWKIILMHHHPFSYSYHVPCVDVSMLEEGSQLLEIASRNEIHLILHGHRHHPNAETSMKAGWTKPLTFICAGSFAVNSSHRSGGSIPNTLHIIELTDEIGVLNLYNYQYSPAQGWIPFTVNTPETPLDYKMKFGKIFSKDQIDAAIQNLEPEKELHWDELEECLQFITFKRLNEQIDQQFIDSRKRIGTFPDEVILLEKGVKS